MTDQRVIRLVRKGYEGDAAAILVQAGYTTPAAIRSAKDEELLSIAGVDASMLEAVRDARGKLSHRKEKDAV